MPLIKLRLIQAAKYSKKFVAKHTIIFVIACLIVISILSITTWHKVKEKRFYDQVTKELMAEEESEPDTPTNYTEADSYVNDFKYTVTVHIGPDGFDTPNILVKPQTKVIIKGSDSSPHLLALAPGSASPKYFEPKADITKNSLFQMKFEEKGSYGFYDKYNTDSALTVMVSE